MRKFLVFLCATTSFGEQFSLESASNSLRDHVSQLVLNGGTRGSGIATVQKNMVDRLLSQMGSELDGDAKKILVQVQTLLADLLQDLKDDRDEKQGLLTAAHNGFNDVIDSALRTQFTSNMGNYAYHHSAHSVCRWEQVPHALNRATVCQTFLNFMSTAFTPSATICTETYDENTNAGLNSYKSALLNGRIAFQTAVDSYPASHDTCEAAMTSEAEKQEECDDLKRDFELFECNALAHRETMCTGENDEYTRLKGDFDTLVTQIQPLSTQRVTDARMIKYLNCLVEQLRTVDNPTLAAMETACEGIKTEDYTADFANTFDTFPDQAVCPLFDPPLVAHEDQYTLATMNGHLTQAQKDVYTITATNVDGLVIPATRTPCA